jgi:hypothetical protein
MRQQASGQMPDDPADDPLDQVDDKGKRDSHRSPMPAMPRIPPRPLDWPPGEGLDLPKTG